MVLFKKKISSKLCREVVVATLIFGKISYYFPVTLSRDDQKTREKINRYLKEISGDNEIGEDYRKGAKKLPKFEIAWLESNLDKSLEIMTYLYVVTLYVEEYISFFKNFHEYSKELAKQLNLSEKKLNNLEEVPFQEVLALSIKIEDPSIKIKKLRLLESIENIFEGLSGLVEFFEMNEKLFEETTQYIMTKINNPNERKELKRSLDRLKLLLAELERLDLDQELEKLKNMA